MSSGQPYKKPSDVQMYRNEYLNDLEMRKDLDKINYDANMNYIKTGALPPQSQMTDNRTVNDKLLDLVSIKKHIITILSPLSSQKYAENVVEALLSNPNNVENKLLIFAAQRAPEIAEQLKKIYSIGIKGDLDDSVKLVSYILKLFIVQHNSMLSLREVQNRFTSDKTSQTSLLGSIREIILQVIYYMEQLQRIPRFGQLMNVEINNLTKLVNFIPDNKNSFKFNDKSFSLNELKEIILNSPLDDDVYIASRYMAFLNSDFANIDELNYLLKQFIVNFNAFYKNQNEENKNKVLKYVTNLYGIIYNDSIIEKLNEFRSYHFIRPDKAGWMDGKYEAQDFLNDDGSQGDSNNEINTGGPREDDKIITGDPFEDDKIITDNNLKPSSPPNWKPTINNETGELFTINDAINDFKNLTESITDYNHMQQQMIKHMFEQTYGTSYTDFNSWSQPINIEGKGLKRGRGRPRGTGIVKPYKQTISENLNTDKGLEESRRFVKFGKYLINMNKLNDNILSLKIPSGGTVIGHPVTKVTSSFSKIVKNMINNVSPSFKDLQSLSDTEKNYLYNISKKANILDKFSIPTPDMSEDDKDINEYEILKGEILAGNDNKDLIKKFKAKIVKMSNKGLLNKKDVSSILHDLLNLNL